MKKYIGLLKWIWLSEKASMIYLSLLENWKSSITEIQNDINIHRVEIYRLLPLLLENWLVKQSIKWKRKLYSPASPTKIEEIYNDIQKSNKWAIAHLVEKYSQLQNKPSISYWKWQKALKEVFNDIIDSQKHWDIFYRITSEIDTAEINKKYLPKNYREKRDKKELERYVIMSSKSAKQKQKRLERELKIIPEKLDEFDDNVFMSIYADKLAYIDFNNESSVIIENKQIADFQKKLFKLLYKTL